MKKFVLVIALLLMGFAFCWAGKALYIGDLKVSLYSEGWTNFETESRPPKHFMEWNFSQIYGIAINTGREYYIRIENTSSNEIGVYVFVDGLNVIGRESEGGRWWYLEPYQTLDLKGWQLDNEFRANFEFVDIGTPSGQGGTYPGWIFIAQYRIYRPRPRYKPHYSAGSEYADEVAAPASAESENVAQSKSKRADAETGAGQVQHHAVTEVDYKLESYPTGLVAIRYGKKKAPPPPPVCNKYIGIDALDNVNEGVYVSNVYPNSPAAMAALEQGDIIRFFNGERVRYIQQLVDAIKKCHGGQKVIMEVMSVRDKRIYDVTIYVGCR